MNKKLHILLTFVLAVLIAAGCSGFGIEKQERKEATTAKTANGLLPAIVTGNIDGDTVEIMLNGKEEAVRLLCIDTPETQHPRLGVQPFGPEASDFAKKILPPGKEIEVELGIGSGRDKYGRLLAYIYVDGKMFNELLLEQGLARVAYVLPPNTKYVDRFYDVQDEAKRKRIGIWSIENYSTEDGFRPDVAPPKEGDDKCIGKIKGNANSKIYHVPGGSYYDSSIKEIEWFCTEQEAREAGYRKAKR